MTPSQNWEHNEGRPATMKDVDAILSKIRPPSTGNPPVMALNLKRMVEATKGGYPKHLYHEALDPVIVLREDQHHELAMLGYVENYIPRQYPRTLYRRNPDLKFEPKFDPATKVLLFEPFVEARLVRDENHEKAVRKDRVPPGCGPWVLRVEEIEPLPDGSGEDPAVTIARLEGQIEEARRAAGDRKK